MICSRCASRISRGSQSLPAVSKSSILASRRTYSTPAATPQSTTPSSSTPKETTKTIVSSIPAGTNLKGINYLKKLQDPIALPDNEYPSWLWTCLENRKPLLNASGVAGGADAADLYGKNKAKRKAALKKLRGMAGQEVVMEVPLDHQTVDMPFEDPEEASAARMDAKRVARARRKAGIKERNFLGGLR